MRGSQITFLALYLTGEPRCKRPVDHNPLTRVHKKHAIGLADMLQVKWTRPNGITIQSSLVPKIALQIAQSISTLVHIYIFKGGSEPIVSFWSVQRLGCGVVFLEESDPMIALTMMEMARGGWIISTFYEI